MKLVLVLLMAVLALGPQVGWAFVPAPDPCQEVDECEEGADCGTACSRCLCCAAARTPGLAAAAVGGVPDGAPCTSTIAAVSAPLAPPPTDILHVPKSA